MGTSPLQLALRRSRGGASFRDGLFGRGFARFEFEADFVAVELQEGREGLAFFRDETRDQIGLSGFDQLQHLFARHFALTNGLSHSEFAFRRVAALIRISCIVHCAGLADRTRSDRRKSGKIDRHPIAIGILAKVEGLFKLSIDLNRRSERPAKLAAKSFERTHAASLEEASDLITLELSARHVFPDDQPAPLAFIRLVRLFEGGGAAPWTLRLQVGELALDAIAGKVFGFGDDICGEAADSVHKFGAWHGAMFHLLQLEFPFAGHLR